jgi:hypothetical protein
MFRFAIRDVLWLMVVVGMGVAWWADRSRLEALRRLESEQYTDERLLTVDQIRKDIELSIPALKGKLLKTSPDFEAAIEKARARARTTEPQ